VTVIDHWGQILWGVYGLESGACKFRQILRQTTERVNVFEEEIFLKANLMFSKTPCGESLEVVQA
jgi:hypothetical protein